MLPVDTPMIYGVWVARCSMIAVFSLPLFAAWAISDGQSRRASAFFG